MRYRKHSIFCLTFIGFFLILNVALLLLALNRSQHGVQGNFFSKNSFSQEN